MSSVDSVTCWLTGVRAGDDGDIRRLWDRYFSRLVALAGARLPDGARREYDEEDVALSAFHSFCDRAGRGQFPQLGDRKGLWRLLATITARKAIRSLEHHTRQKRGGGEVLGEYFLMGKQQEEQGAAQLFSREPNPEDADEFAEDLERRLADLGNPTLRTIASRKLEGHSSEEIAAELGITARTVDRKLELIRDVWGSSPQ